MDKIKDALRVAILMTCHNRRETTLNCLKHVFSQTRVDAMQINVFLVDDGSTDGTGAAVKEQFPEVTVLEGNGSLYWVGGMRRAFGKAIEEDFDFYLWLNDDTNLDDRAFERLFDTFFDLLEKTGKPVIVAGSVCDEKTRELTYGGSMLGSWWCPTRYNMIQPSRIPRKCDLFHGNCVLIPREVARTVGNMSPDYQHGPGDKDYALRARKAGFSSWICPGYVGTCSRNRMLDLWKTADLSMQERVEILNHPVIVARVQDWVVFTKRYHRILLPYYFITSFIRLKLPRLYILLKTGF